MITPLQRNHTFLYNFFITSYRKSIIYIHHVYIIDNIYPLNHSSTSISLRYSSLSCSFLAMK